MCEPRKTHWVAAKHVLRYLCGTVGYGLHYTMDSDMQLVGYTDPDWASSVEDRKSTSGCYFSLGSTVISWFSRKQTSVALSSMEAEYIAACMVAWEAVSLRKLLAGLFGHMLELTVIRCDNQSCVHMLVNPVHHDQTKHVEM